MFIVSPVVYFKTKNIDRVKLALVAQGYTADTKGIRRFQKEHNLIQNGVLDYITLYTILFYSK